MIEVILLLVGGDYLQRRWGLLVVLGIVWLVAGSILGIDALDGRLTFPLESFALLVLLECLVAFSLARSGLSLAPRLRLIQASALAVVAILILSPWDLGDVLIAFGLAAAFAVDGLTRMVTAWYVRFPGWQVTLGGGALLLLLAVTFVVPWQPGYVDAIPYCIGLGLAAAGLALVRAGLGLRGWPAGSAIAPHLVHARFTGAGLQLPPVPPTPPGRQPLVVRVWTALGTADHPVLHHHALLDRYIAAVDVQGTISTGHSALELPPDLYISHYPAVEIDHSRTEFQHLFRATPDNDVPGRFQPSYAVESAEWSPANRHVAFRRFNPARLRAFWDAYRQDTTYNLTYRNCSSTVALALDCAIEGNLARHGVGPYLLLRVLLTPELWIAAQLRHRARTMAWTPGILLDYAMAMRALQDPPASGLLALIRLPFPLLAPPLTGFTLMAVIAAAAMFGVTYGLSAPLIALDLHERGFTEVTIGLNAAMHAVGVLLVAPVLPRLAARFGQRPLTIVALLAAACLLGLFPLVALTLLWFPLRAALGAASELLFTLTESWTNELSPEAARGRIMAAYTAALSLGFAAGPALLAHLGSGDRAYFAGAVLALAAIVPLLWPRLRVPRREEAPPIAPLRSLRLAPLAIAATLLNAAVETSGLSFITLYATKMGWSQTAGMHLITTLLVGAIVLQLPIGWLADRLPARGLVLVLAVVAAVGAWAAPAMFAQPWLAFGAVFVWGGVFVGIYTVMLVAVGNRFKGAELIAIYATMGFAWGVGALLGPTLAGLAMAWDPTQGLPTMIALACAGFALLTLGARSTV